MTEKEHSIFNIAIVGGSTCCKEVLEKTAIDYGQKEPGARFRVVADMDIKSPGILFAKKMGIETCSNYEDLYNPQLNIHLIIILTPDQEILDNILSTRPPHIPILSYSQFEIFRKSIGREEQTLIETSKEITSQNQAKENLFVNEKYRERSRFENMIGQSKQMKDIFDLIQDIAPMNSTLLITGETGTGKGLAAKAVHSNSRHCEGPFVVVNCGAIPENLMESELFGYQSGAFTDAKKTKRGRLELAHGGTLFLDEIGEISMRMQIDLLRVLEDRVFYRVGGTLPVQADFRIIAATNKDLIQAVKEGSFREDLYYRLNVISFEMPPLRERREDVLLLAEYFLHRFTKETNKNIDGFTRDAIDELMLYEWPGNVRELENAVERAVVVGKSKKIIPDDLPIFNPELMAFYKGNSLKEMEKGHIYRILENNSWNISRSAAILGIDRSTLYSKIKRYNIHKQN
ncbi:sigma-54 interaction domain-containing protein [Thermodesulfobacteriota bacterium]